MRIYKYSKDTKEYLGYMEAYLDPLETELQKKEVYVIPPYFTNVKPEQPKEDNTVVFNGTDWEEVEDNRGLHVYDKKSGEERIITELGPIPSTYQKEKPIFLEDLRAQKIAEINEQADNAKREDCTVNGIKASAETWIELSRNIAAFELFPTIIVNDVVVTKEELEEAIKYLYIRSMLISERRLELLKEISSTRSKKKLDEFAVDFDIEADIKKVMKLSKKELNKRFSKG